MKIRDFGVEMWMNAYENDCRWNLAETCVHSMTVGELLALSGKGEEVLRELSDTRLTYGEIEGSLRLRRGIAGLYRAMGPENITVTNGAIGANALTMLTLVEPGDRVISVLPTYQQHYSIPESIGARVDILRLREENGWLPDPDELRRLVREAGGRVRMININNPNNPTGAVMGEGLLREMVEIAREAGAWLLCDEVYRGLEGKDMPSILDYGYHKAISVSSLSKMFSMAGTRIGWIVCRDQEMYEVMKTRRSYNTICCGIVDEEIGSVALENYEALWARARSILLPNRQAVADWVRTQPHLRMRAMPMGTTCLIEYDYGIGSEALARDAMAQDKILFVPGDYFDMPGTIRLGFGAFRDTGKLQAGLEALGKYLEKYN